MMRLKEVFLFLLCSLLSCLAVFQDAMWGKSIAAPLDIAPALWRHYQHVDPTQGPIPKNHYIVDQLSYDLPLQHLMYHGWRSGEVPWWNPYTLGGRPLLADAHCNGTDPIRLAVYFVVPDFVPAYNWVLILHCVATGAGFFLLLREFGTRAWLAGLCAIAAQWAGGYVLYIGHPWVRASFLYYPFLWLVWHRGFHSSRFSFAAPLLVAAVLYSGNLQSHSYLPVFATAIWAGYGGLNAINRRRLSEIVLSALALGALIAAPVLVPQLELFLHAERPIAETPRIYWIETGAILAAIHPWTAGTFRTISVKSVSAGPSFHLAIGGALIVLACFAWMRRKNLTTGRNVLVTSAWLIAAFLLIALTPLQPLLYLRAAGLAIIGLTVLAARGAETLLRSEARETRWGGSTWALAGCIAVGTAVLAHVIYPRFQARAEATLLARAESDRYGGASRDLRRFQAANFTAEVSPLNAECAMNLAGISLLAIAFAMPRRGPVMVGAALGTAIIPLLLFAERFIVRSPVDQWTRLLQGGPKQKAVVAKFSSAIDRYEEEERDYERIFPHELAALYQLHVIHGYAALEPRRAGNTGTGAHEGIDRIRKTPDNGFPRFFWKSGSDREISVTEESLSRLRLACYPAADDVLLWADTPYPGWRKNNEPIEFSPSKAVTELSVRAEETELSCQYYPSWHAFSLGCAPASILIAGGLAWRSKRQNALVH